MKVKNFRRRDGREVSFVLTKSGQWVKSRPVQSTLVYHQHPLHLEYYDRGMKQLVARYAQLGDTVYHAEFGVGEVILDPQNEDVTVEFRGGLMQDIALIELAVVHHNVEGCDRRHVESLLTGATMQFRSAEEAEFHILQDHQRMVQLSKISRFQNRNDRAFERARQSDGTFIKPLRELLERCWEVLS